MVLMEKYLMIPYHGELGCFFDREFSNQKIADISFFSQDTLKIPETCNLRAEFGSSLQ